MPKFLKSAPNFLKSKWVIALIVIVVLGIGGYFIFHKSPTYQFVTVEEGPIDETVTLTGNSTPAQSVALTFSTSGTVSHTYSSLGKKVVAGQLLAELNTSDLLAQLHNAQAGLILAEEHTTASKDNVANVTAQQDAIVASARQNVYSNFAAVPENQFTSLTAPTVSGSYTGTEDGKYVIDIYASGGSTGASFNYSGLESGTESVTINTDVPLGTHGLFIRFPVSSKSYANSKWTVSIPNTRSNTYADAVKDYKTALETRDKAIADAQANVGSTTISAVAMAEIAQAQSSIDSINAKLRDAKIFAPISGTITQFDAKVGQFASQSMPLVSIISNKGYEVDSGVSETDIGKISLGDKVSMTLDAFPNETFAGKVFYIAPAETNTEGVVSYEVKISFDNPDPRLKSGLTANIDIQTKHKDKVLILPQYAILQNDDGTFVETLENEEVVQHPVTLGIEDRDGNVEVLTGVTLGEQVLNIGLKTK